MNSQDENSKPTITQSPTSVVSPDGIRTIAANTDLEGEIAFYAAVQYHPHKPNLAMDVMMPMRDDHDGGALPTVLFVQGSGWTTSKRLYAMPRLIQLARRGFTVATINHTDSQNGTHPFPEYLMDVKAALRFLRINAKQYRVDPDRIGAWGTSSGGNAVLLLGMTQDDSRYDDGSNPSVSDHVSYVVACFPPADIPALLGRDRTPGIVDCVEAVTGGGAELARAMSPQYVVTAQTQCPPTLLLHGDADTLVPYAQSEQLYLRMREQGHDVRMIRVAGADHESNFWGPEVVDAIIDYITAHA